jgi:ABC-type lipoprotein release transport system permease subunit
MLLVENLGLASLAVVLGLRVGRLLAPGLARSSVTVLGAPEMPPLSWARIAIVAAVAFAVVMLATIRPAIRGYRQSTLSALSMGVRSPRRPGRLARLTTDQRLPFVAIMGLRSARRRPGRLLTNAAGLTLGVAMIVVALGLRSSLSILAIEPVERGHALSGTGIDVLYDQVRMIVLGTAALLLVLGTINAFIVATFAARDSARTHAALRALGATPRQTKAVLVVSQLGACALAVLLGIPVGLGLWSVMEGGDLPPVNVSTPSLALLSIAVPLAFAAIVSIPAGILARRPVAPLLTYE